MLDRAVGAVAPYPGPMVAPREFVALISHWNGRWDVYVLDPAQGLVVDQTAADSPADAERAARQALYVRFGSAALDFCITVHDGRAPTTFRAEPRAAVPQRPMSQRPTTRAQGPTRRP